MLPPPVPEAAGNVNGLDERGESCFGRVISQSLEFLVFVRA